MSEKSAHSTLVLGAAIAAHRPSRQTLPPQWAGFRARSEGEV